MKKIVTIPVQRRQHENCTGMKEGLQKALQLLAMREHSAVELSQKLSRSGFTAQDIARILAYCKQQGYQSDARFAEQFCKVRIAKGQGPLKITHELKQHGFTQSEITFYYETLEVDWVKLAIQVLDKQAWRFKRAESLSKPMRFLMARGFPVDIIRLSLKERSVYEDR